MSMAPNTEAPARRRGLLTRFASSDLIYDFVRSPIALVAFLVFIAITGAALLAPLIAPTDPFDPAAANIIDARLPPMSEDMFGQTYLLGSDPQGRDMLSAILYGARTSLLVGFASVAFAAIVGLTLGLVSGFFGGFVDTVIMRIADVQLSFPAILVALLVDGLARTVISRSLHEEIAILVLIFAIGISNWVQYARTVRSVVLVERRREYVEAARVTGVHPIRIIAHHLLPNVMGPVTVIATISLALAIIAEIDTLVPRCRRAAHATLARHAGADRQRVSVLRQLVDHDLSGRRSSPRRPVGEPGR